MRVKQITLGEFTALYAPLIRTVVPASYNVEDGVLWEVERWKQVALVQNKVAPRMFALELDNGTVLPYSEMSDLGKGVSLFGHPMETRLIDSHALWNTILIEGGLGPILKSAKERTGDNIFFPLVRKNQYRDFDDLIRNGTGKMKYRSTMLGTKGDRVKWSWEAKPSFSQFGEISALADMHNMDYGLRHDQSWDFLMVPWTWYKTMGVPMSIATDTSTGKMVCAMACIEGHMACNADLICRNTDAEYSGYSLTAVAHLAMLRDVFWNSEDPVMGLNLGLNFEDMDYKRFLDFKEEPLMNLPNYAKGSSADTIQAAFEAELSLAGV